MNFYLVLLFLIDIDHVISNQSDIEENQNFYQYVLINKTAVPFACQCTEKVCSRHSCETSKPLSTTNYRVEMIFLNLDTNETSYGCSNQTATCKCCGLIGDGCKINKLNENDTLFRPLIEPLLKQSCYPIIVTNKNGLYSQYVVGENYTFSRTNDSSYLFLNISDIDMKISPTDEQHSTTIGIGTIILVIALVISCIVFAVATLAPGFYMHCCICISKHT